MSQPRPGTLEEKVRTVREIVDRIVFLGTGMEHPDWLEKFVRVRDHLAQGDLRAAEKEEGRLTRYDVKAKWVVSWELERTLEKAFCVLRRQLYFPDHVEPTFDPGPLPTNIAEKDTQKMRSIRLEEEFEESFVRDPLEEDPANDQFLAAVDDQVEAALAAEGDTGGWGYCHRFWARKKAFLWEEHGLHWQSPSELNPNILYD